MNYTQLILSLIGAIPGVATALEQFFQKNPRLQGETDDAYAARLNAQTLVTAADTTAADNAMAGDSQSSS